MTQYGQTTVSGRVREIRGKIQAWLMQEGWKIGEQVSPDTQWIILAEDEHQRKIAVAQKIGRDDQVIIQGGVNVVDPIRGQFMAISQQQRQEFLNDLGLKLIEINCEFAGLKEPLETIIVTQRIYYDALTKDAFLQRASLVRNGLLVVLWAMARRFGQAPPASPPDEHRIGFRTPE